MSRGWRRLALAGMSVLLVGVLAAAALALWTYRELERPLPVGASPERPVEIDIEPGTGVSTILSELHGAGVIARTDLARLLLVVQLDDPPLRAGEYRFDHPASTRENLEKVIRGDVVQHPVTIVEGLTLEETAAQLAGHGFGDERRFLEAMHDPGAIADLDPLADDLEGYLFPDTYAFPRHTSEERIVQRMVETFRSQLDLHVRALAPERSVRELVTLASIVEREAALDEERPLIAAVYANRLRIGMGLYADPTVIYALKRQGVWDGNLRRRDLELDSPYNTYRYPGLPPGPICSPGLRSLQAAAAPADESYLYFVSRNDGSHVFSRTLQEHNRNVEKWQRQYWRERWARERAEGAGRGRADGANARPDLD